MERKSAWEIWNDRTKQQVMSFCADYKEFLSGHKTERKFVAGCVRQAEESGFQELTGLKRIAAGNRVYKINRNKQVIFCALGKDGLADGGRFIVSHVDSPRIDLKPVPVYEEENLVLLKTCYYGGIKKYHWLGLPLALYGVAVLKNGKKKEIEIGDKPDDPIFTITDLLPHLAKDQMKKTIEEGFPGENMNILAGSIPLAGKQKEKTKSAVLKILKEKFGLEEQDLISAELQAVPAGPARDLGFDRSMIIAYGQDARVCSYAGFRALLETARPRKAAFCILTDQEEIGSRGTTSAHSAFFEYFLEELIEKTGEKTTLRNIFENSQALSADVASALDPNYKEVHDLRNASRLGCGVTVEKTTGAKGKSGSTEPTAEYLAYIRGIFDKHKVIWQTGEIGKVEQGGGGTVATYLARFNMDTVDCGTGVLSMHAPFEVTSKADIYSTYQAYLAFYKEV